MPLQHQTKSDAQEMIALLSKHVTEENPDVMQALEANRASFDPAKGDPHAYLLSELKKASDAVHNAPHHDGENFHSQNPLAALAQAHLSKESQQQPSQYQQPDQHGSLADEIPAVIDVFGEGNPVVWAPVMINILLEHLRPKADFQTATDAKSYIAIPDKCSIALLGDWGADNDHARRIAKLVVERGATIVIHLGDIYYAGNQYECERFLANWPLPISGRNSFALNGNHEMYSRGIPYFNTVLTKFGQEASYFTLYNQHWQLHGLDTAYVPFSIDGTVPVDKPGFWRRIFDKLGAELSSKHHENFDAQPDSRLEAQSNWFKAKLANSGTKKNIFLSHNQPISAYLPEFEAGSFLQDQFRRLRETIPGGQNIVHSWFFGHEHKGTIYRDDKTEYKARLIGNGAIPHSRQALTPPDRDERAVCTPVFTMNTKALRPDFFGIHELDLAVSTFALLTLDGPDAYVEYINEDGSLFLKEKLSGGPNEVLAWGEGYEPLPLTT